MLRSVPILLLVAVSPSPASAAECNCTAGVVGAVLGTFFGTLLLVAIVLLLLWFCCLRQRLAMKAHSEPAYQVPENPPAMQLHDMQGHVHRDSLWGVPSALKKFLKKCSLAPDSVHQIKLNRNPDGDSLDFSVASRGVGLFLKDVDSTSKLGHVRHLEEGAHLLGLSVAFDSWPASQASDFISRAAPFRPHLHVRCAPLFRVEELSACKVLSAAPAPVAMSLSFPEPQEEEEELVRVHLSQGVKSAPPMFDSRPSTAFSADCESVELSEEHPAELRQSGMLTFDRTNDVQTERVLIVRSSLDAGSDSDSTPRPTPAAFSLSPAFGDGSDIYRATPVHLETDDEMAEFDLEACAEPPGASRYRLASPLDSGVGTGPAHNGGSTNGLGSSEASHEAQFAARLSGGSSPLSVNEEPVRQAVSTRAQLAPRLSAAGAHPELAQLDRKIALNNIEIATLMLNDSASRRAQRDVCVSESEAESAHEDQIQPEALQRPRILKQSAVTSEDDLAFRADCNTALRLEGRVNGAFEEDEAYA